MPHCVAYKCNSDAKKKDPNISFHILPKRLSVRKRWIQAISRPEDNLPKKPHLCSLHFDESCFDESFQMKSRLLGSAKLKRKLKQDAVPTIFWHKTPPKPRQSTLDRLARNRHKEVIHVSLTEHISLEGLEEQPPSDMFSDNEVIPPVAQEQNDMHACHVAVQTENYPYASCSTSTQTNIPTTKETAIQCDKMWDSEDMVDLDESIQLFSEDEDDGSSYIASTQETLHSCSQSSQHSEDSHPLEDDELILVHSNCLKGLFNHCPNCGGIVESDNIKPQQNEGTLLTVNLTCINGCDFKWKSQNELKNARGSVNMILTSAITLSGVMFEKWEKLASLMKLKSISHGTFYKLRQNYLYPAINDEWKKEQESVIQSIKDRGESVMLAGDGRCDSPGHSAKYGTYTMLDTETDKVVDFEVVKVMDVKNSNAMEKEGFIKTLTRIEDDFGCEVYGVSTDRHIQIKKYMRENHKEKVHQIDPWHLIKGINKKINAAAKKKNCSELLEWGPSITNHFWWSVDSCEGDEDSLAERFTSLIHHTTNKHSWPGCKKYKKCDHDRIARNVARKKKWLKASSPAHQALVKIVKNKRILNDLKLTSQGVTTTMLEVYHSLYLKYLPKIQHFAYDTMVAGTQLAALDHNKNIQRNQAIITQGERQGEGRYKIKWSKVTKKFTAQPVLEKKNYKYLEAIIRAAAKKIELMEKPTKPKPRHCMAPLERDHRNTIIDRTIQYCRLPDKN